VEHGDAAVRRELRVVALDAAVRMITIDEAHVESRPTAPCPFGFACVESKAAIKGLAKTTRIERTGLRNGLIAIGGLTPRRMALGWPLGARGGPNGVMLQSSVCLRTARPSKDTLRRVIKANVPRWMLTLLTSTAWPAKWPAEPMRRFRYDEMTTHVQHVYTPTSRYSK
jgi:hypothetical protein